MDNQHHDYHDDYDNFDYHTYYDNFFVNGGDSYGATLLPLAYPSFF